MASSDSVRSRRRPDPVESRGGGQRRWLDAALAAAVVYVASLVIVAAVERSENKLHLRTAAVEARAMYDAFERFHKRNGRFPDTWREPRFDVDTLAPLTTRGYYRGSIATKLVEGSVDAYESPDPNGDEFWLEMTLAADPHVRLLVARSDDAPLGGGAWRDGVFVHRRGKLEQL